MGTTADKLQAVLNSKNAIKAALIEKGVVIDDNTRFSQYAQKIAQMTVGQVDTSWFEVEALSIIGQLNGSQSTLPSTGGTCKFYKCASVTKAQTSQQPQSAQPYFLVQNAVSYPELNGVYKYAGKYNSDVMSQIDLYILQNTTNVLYYHTIDQAWYISPTSILLPQDKYFGGDYPYYNAYDTASATELHLNEFRGSGVQQPNLSCKKYEPSSEPPADVPKTWGGYQLLLQNGVYKVSDVLTQNLTYSSVVPEVGRIYTADALVKIATYFNGMPDEGLVFYAPLSHMVSSAETGQPLTQISADSSYPVKYVIENGIPCAAFGSAYDGVDHGYCGLTFPSEGMPSGTNPRTISCWVKLYSMNTSDVFLGLGTTSRAARFGLRWYSNYQTFIVDGHYTGVRMENQIEDGLSWHHIVFTFDESNINGAQFYVDGTAVSTIPDGSENMSTVLPSYCVIGAGEYGNYARFDGWLSSVRIYNRVLSFEEITALANEFTPTGV